MSNQDRKQRAKGVSVMSVMERAGYRPVRDSSSRAQFLSPFRAESHPSFMVDKAKNVWVDYGVSTLPQDSIDLVMQLEGCGYHAAIDRLLGGDGLHNHRPVPEAKVREHGIDILENNDITNPYLLAYGESRGIDPSLLRRYCREISFRYRRTPHIIHHAIGFENNKGGFELRNNDHKVGNSPKTYRTIRSGKNEQACDVFEGFFDFLSHLQLNQWDSPAMDSYVMNSLVYAPFIEQEVHERLSVNLYLDNDAAADRFILDNFQGPQYHIMHRALYPEFEDYNDFVKFKLLNNG